MLEDPHAAVSRMKAAGVARAVTIGVDGPTSEWAVAAAVRMEDVWATVGLHPHDAKLRSDQMMARLEDLATSPQVVGVGEAGLDYHYDNSPRAQQRDVFAEHIELAKRVDKALVVHSREAWDDTFAILTVDGAPRRVVFHCFSGGPAEAERALALGAVLSFSGVVTFRNAGELREAARIAPLDRVVVETDAPFLTPVPHRGTTNEPARVVHVVEAVAQVKDVSVDEAIASSGRVASALFGWD